MRSIISALVVGHKHGLRYLGYRGLQVYSIVVLEVGVHARPLLNVRALQKIIGLIIFSSEAKLGFFTPTST